MPLSTKEPGTILDEPVIKSSNSKKTVAALGIVPGERGEGPPCTLHVHLSDDPKEVSGCTEEPAIESCVGTDNKQPKPIGDKTVKSNTAPYELETLVNIGNTGRIRAVIGMRSYSTELSGPLSLEKVSKRVGTDHRKDSDAIIHADREDPSEKNLGVKTHHVIIKGRYAHLDVYPEFDRHTTPGKESVGTLEETSKEYLDERTRTLTTGEIRLSNSLNLAVTASHEVPR